MKHIQTTILMLALLSLCGCEGFGRTAKIGEPFTLKTNESATVRGTGIQITLNHIGRKWGTKPQDGESLDLSFSVSYNGKTETYSEDLSKPITVGKYKIEAVETEPFGTGYVIFVVNKNDSNDAVAADFVEKFGWHIDESIAPTKISLEVPTNFNNPSFGLYQSASKAAGLDLSGLRGKTVELWKYTLKEKQSDGKQKISVFACLIIENGKIAGAWRSDSSARVPGIYSLDKQ